MRSGTVRQSPTDLLREVEVTCPHCDRPTCVPAPDDGVELRVRASVSSFGEYSTARCPDDHAFLVYYC